MNRILVAALALRRLSRRVASKVGRARMTALCAIGFACLQLNHPASAGQATLTQLTIACNGMTFDHFRTLFHRAQTAEDQREIHQKCTAFPAGTVVEVMSSGIIGDPVSGELIQIRADDDYVPGGNGLRYVRMIFADSAKIEN